MRRAVASICFAAALAAPGAAGAYNVWTRHSESFPPMTSTVMVDLTTRDAGDTFLWIPWPSGQANLVTISQVVSPAFPSCTPSASQIVEYTYDGGTNVLGWWIIWREIAAGTTLSVSIQCRTSTALAFDGIETDAQTSPTSDWVADSPTIRKVDVQNQAEAIWGGTLSALDYVYSCQTWILENISYDDSHRADQSAGTVLFEGSGTCQGMSSLLIALLRAKGIPAGYVFGTVLPGTTTYSWAEGGTPRSRSITAGPGLHGWVRVWIEDTWQDADPTFGMYCIAHPGRVSHCFHTDPVNASIRGYFTKPGAGGLAPSYATTVLGWGPTTTVTADSAFSRFDKSTIHQSIPPTGPPRMPPYPTVSVDQDRDSAVRLAWPNPSEGVPTLASGTSLYDAAGRLVWSGSCRPPRLAPGVYFAGRSRSESQKVVVLR